MRYKLENNAAKSILFFTFLAIRGDSRSMETLGDIYYKGLGDVAPNPAKAMDWFKASFHRGSPSGIQTFLNHTNIGNRCLLYGHALQGRFRRASRFGTCHSML